MRHVNIDAREKVAMGAKMQENMREQRSRDAIKLKANTSHNTGSYVS